MTTEWSPYVLQGDGSSVPFTRSQVLGPDRSLHVVAIGSLEGWGDMSDEFSEDFLDALCLKATEMGDLVLADFAQLAFQESLARHKPQHPPWSSVQYVAAYVDHSTLRASWIGDMYLLGWKSGKRYIANTPHLVKGVDATGREKRAVLRCLGLTRPESEERQPEVGGLHTLERPTVLFLGNQNPESLLHGSQAVQQVLMSSNSHEFMCNCNVVDKALAGASVRGLFVYV
jgi:hypothetical protein